MDRNVALTVCREPESRSFGTAKRCRILPLGYRPEVNLHQNGDMIMIWKGWVSLGLLATVHLIPARASAQLAPMGGHYAGRPSDTGHAGSVNSSGGYQAAVPLDLPPARGGMPVPVQITYSEHGFGAGGLGWDVPLSYIRRDTSVARRRPVGNADVTPQPREQLSLMLQGQRIDLVPTATGWVARRDAPGIEVRSAADGTMVMYDGAGRAFHFSATGPGGVPLASGKLYLLRDVTAAAGNVHLDYNITTVQPPGGASALSLDLASVSYNSAPSTTDCYKNKVILRYRNPGSPQSYWTFGDQIFARVDVIDAVDVVGRASCGAPDVVLRTYQLTYQPDLDTQQLRLASVSMTGREGTAEHSVSVPIANYKYGAAVKTMDTGQRILTYAADPQIPVGNAVPLGSTRTDPPSHPSDPTTYSTGKTFIDLNGDGRPERISGATIAHNRPTGPGGTIHLGAPNSGDDEVLALNPLESRTTAHTRYADFQSMNDEKQWRQAIDVNGDGRVDIIDAAEQPGAWVVYVNTPSPTNPERIVLQRYAYSTALLGQRLRAAGLWTGDDFIPLALRSTVKDRTLDICVGWSGHAWFEIDNETEGVHGCPIGGRPNDGPFRPERTVTQWQLTDVNADGYPDVLFNSNPVMIVATDDLPPPPTHPPLEPVHISRVLRASLGDPTGPRFSPNALMAAFNIVGVHFPADNDNPFSAPFVLRAGVDCGFTRWESTDPSFQRMTCGVMDVNGDGLADFVSGTSVFLGTGSLTSAQFFTASPLLTLPDSLAIQFNNQTTACEPPATPDTVFTVSEAAGLRDVTGDGIPDYITSGFVHVGTGTGFAGFASFAPNSSFQGLSLQVENCGGTFSNNQAGVYDLDGDGRADFVSSSPDNANVISVHRLRGSEGRLGAPEAGRLVSVDNGYGAKTTIVYRSAKEDASTRHQVPFPEIVVSSIATTGTQGLGGDLSAASYAYGDAELVFDAAADAFTFHGYRRTTQLTTPTAASQGVATITDAYGPAMTSDPFGVIDPAGNASLATTPEQRYLTALRMGRPRDTTVLSGSVGNDPWALLGINATSDPRRISATHYEWGARPLSAASDPPGPDTCDEMVLPYDFHGSSAYAISNGRNNFCTAHGFGFELTTQTWRGAPGAAPPSTENVVTRTEVRSIDDFGRVLSVSLLNDLNRADDDVCIDTTYATPVGSSERVLGATASRRVSNCAATIYSRGTWEYDQLNIGQVSHGFLTSYNSELRSDTGVLTSTRREFDATHDSVGNVTSVTQRRQDGAIRIVQTTHDAFAIAPVSVFTVATGISTTNVTTTRDPITLDVLSTTDANGTQRGNTFDGFQRPVRSTITSPDGGPHGITSTMTYLGFDGRDSKGRRLVSKAFVDPVSDPSAAGRTSTTFLDELGRARNMQVALGSDYTNETLVVGARTYDGLGRVVFEADPYPLSQDATTAYGTTRFFNADGTPSCFVRGNGRQPTLASLPATDESLELYPTCFSHSFQDNTELVGVRDASSLLAGSPQFGVVKNTYTDATGRQLATSTGLGSTRLEHATFTYDRLGHKTSMTRYLNAAAGASPVTTSWHTNSIGEIVEIDEPNSAPQFRSYDNWGELIDVTRSVTAGCPEGSGGDPQIPGSSCGGGPAGGDDTPPTDTLHVVTQYDALGRIIRKEERTNDVTNADTVAEFVYDRAVLGHGRLNRASTRTSSVSFGYDAFGHVAQKSFIDNQGATYFQTYTYHGDGTLATLGLALPDTGYADELIQYSYDSAGRDRTVDYELGPFDQSLFNASTIDAFGRVRQASHGAAIYTGTYADTGRRLVREASVVSPHGSRTITFQGFDPMLRERSRTENSGGATTTTSVTYDALGRVLSTAKARGATMQNEQFSYDALGNVLSLSSSTDGRSGLNTQLTYLDNDRDRICNIAYSAEASPGCNVVYDELGNIVRQPTRDGTRRFAYFIDGGIRSIADDHSSAHFLYDAFGNIQDLQLSSDTSSDSRHDRRFGDLLEWREPINGQGPEFAHLIRKIPGPNGVVASRRGNGGPWMFQFGEARGNRFSTDEDGVFVQDVDYSTYGDVLTANPESVKPGNVSYNNEQWNGGDSLKAFGLHHLGARLYDPIIGRFLSRDPLLIPRTAATTNPYAFAMNDPVNGSDPSGLDSCPEGNCPSPPLLPCVTDPVYCLKAVASGASDAANAVGNAISDAASAVGDFFSGGDSSPARVAPGPARSLMGAARFGTPGQPGGTGSSTPQLKRVLKPYGSSSTDNVLSASAARILGDYFSRMYQIDVSSISLVFGNTWGADAYTIGYNVTIDKDVWNSYSPLAQMMLLAHEFTHTAQYVALDRQHSLLSKVLEAPFRIFTQAGVTPSSIEDFLLRYWVEFADPKNYIMPAGLDPRSSGAVPVVPIGDVKPFDSRWTLDQIAERNAAEIQLIITGSYK